MKKVLYFAAAAALALGVTACSDDDENETNSFSDTYTLKYDLFMATESEEKAIINAYNNAIGFSGTTESTVTIAGKDSADCVTKLDEMLSVANSKVDNMNIDSENDYTVSAYNQNGYLVYVKHIGEGENSLFGSTIRKKVIPFSGSQNGQYVYSFNVYETRALTDIINTYNAYNQPIEFTYSCNVNKCADSKSTDMSIRATYANYNGASHCVSDVIIYNSESKNGGADPTITFEGRTYSLAYGYIDDYKSGNMNMDANLPAIYLYYTTDTYWCNRSLLTSPLAICYKYEDVRFWFNNGKTAVIEDFADENKEYTDKGYTVEFAPEVRKAKDGTYYQYQPNGDLNAGLTLEQSRLHLYLRCVYEKDE